MLIADLSRRATHMSELIPEQHPRFMGASDAAKAGMGGVWLPPVAESALLMPILWRAPFPRFIQEQVVSVSNPHGRVTNSDLELAATVAQQAVLAREYDLAGCTTHSYCDNTPAVSWQQKGSTTTTGPAAYLLRVGALHQRINQYLPRYQYLPGPVNVMADDASRRWDLTDDELLTHFALCYPQHQPWRLLTIPPRTNSALISSLCRKRLLPEWSPVAPSKQRDTGKSGATTVGVSEFIPASLEYETPSRSSRCSLDATGMDALRPVVDRLGLERWKTPYGQWARRFPHWGPRTPGSQLQIESTSDFSANSGVIKDKTRRRPASDLSRGKRYKEPLALPHHQPALNANEL